ncbi:glyoxalase [Pseudoalteromonas luteoviolacea S2607]|uniref:VOC family protein n=1 Tax=Pseudoalteromonas luteoviolacea TaxID=43657 RepID=UPI0007B092D4|nr:VOC family protein [Pseudoalteromonas luteoviolacea]KZN28756.1 glyoxalase [Pseudoalteromonas luteoviolacea S2607]
MHFLKTVIYVDDVEEVLDFYFQAFGLSAHSVTENGDYGELETGTVLLAFATHPVAQSQFKQTYIRSQPKQPALGFELTLGCENVSSSYDKAVAAGAEPLSAPSQKGIHTQAYVRAIEGTLIALVSESAS